MIVSTPNRDLLDPETTLGDQPFNRFRVREYSAGEFDQRLLAYFPAITRYGQKPYAPVDVEGPGHVGRRSPALALKLRQARKLTG